MKRVILIILFATLFYNSILASMRQTQLPDRCWMYLDIGGVLDVIDDLQKLLIRRGSNLSKDYLKKKFSRQLLGGLTLAGIDLTRGFRFYSVSRDFSKLNESSRVIAAPTKNETFFRANILPALQRKAKKKLYVRFKFGYAFFSDDKWALEHIVNSKKIFNVTMKPGENLRLVVRIDRIRSVALNNLAQPSLGNLLDVGVSKSADILKKIIQEIDSLHLSIGINDRYIRINSALGIRKKGKIYNFLNGKKLLDCKLLRFVPARFTAVCGLFLNYLSFQQKMNIMLDIRSQKWKNLQSEYIRRCEPIFRKKLLYAVFNNGPFAKPCFMYVSSVNSQNVLSVRKWYTRQLNSLPTVVSFRKHGGKLRYRIVSVEILDGNIPLYKFEKVFSKEGYSGKKQGALLSQLLFMKEEYFFLYKGYYFGFMGIGARQQIETVVATIRGKENNVLQTASGKQSWKEVGVGIRNMFCFISLPELVALSTGIASRYKLKVSGIISFLKSMPGMQDNAVGWVSVLPEKIIGSLQIRTDALFSLIGLFLAGRATE